MSAPLLDGLRDVVTIGAGLVPVDGGRLVLVRPKYPRPDDEPSAALLAALHEHKAAILELVSESAIRKTWRIAEDVPLNPQMLAILTWLALERAAFGPEDWRRWLVAKSAHIDAGASFSTADILATEAVALEKPTASIGNVVVVGEAA